MTEVGGGTATAAARRAVRGPLIVALTVVLGCVILGVGARLMPPLSGSVGDPGWTQRSHAWFISQGFFPPEVDLATGRQFSWTGRTVRLELPHLDRSRPYRLTFRLSAGRPPGVPGPPIARASVDNGVVAIEQTTNESRPFVVPIPVRRGEGAVVVLDFSTTFQPGPSDRRALGVVVDNLALEASDAHFRPSVQVLGLFVLAVLACCIGVVACGLGSVLAIAACGVVACTFAWLTLLDAAFIGPFPERLLAVALGLGACGTGVGIARLRWFSGVQARDMATAIGLVLALTAVNLAIFGHPNAIIGDGIFQVHRAQLVHRGNYFFTSITPRPFFEFPYPVALYVVAQPFWRFFTSEVDLVWLLRAISVVANSLVALALFAAVRRQWNHRVAALLCAVLWFFAIAPFEALSNANLTNAFGQSVFAAGMGLTAWTAARGRTSIAALLVAGLLMAVGFLSHFGTLCLGALILAAAVAALGVAGRGWTRRFAAALLIVSVGAAAVSYGVYYSRFTEVYRKTFARVAAREGEAPTRSIVAPRSVKLRRWVAGTVDDYGLPAVPVLVVSSAGAVLLLARRRREPLTLILIGWGAAWIAAVVLGILTPMAMRANLAAAPVFVCLSAYALAALGTRSRLAASFAVLIALVVAWDGVRWWFVCLGVPSPF